MDLKVLTYNIQEGGAGRLQSITTMIRSQRPDVVALLEANSRDNAEAFAHGLGMRLAFGEANGEYHVAWLSALPIQRVENHRLQALAKTLLEIEVAWHGAGLRLFAMHLASSHEEPLRPRLGEIKAILDALRPMAGQPHLLAGDLNALAPGDPVGQPPEGIEKRGDALLDAPRKVIRTVLDAGYVDCYRTLHAHRPGYTYPSDAPWLRLDYIFASSTLAARLAGCDVVVGKEAEEASDHLPVYAEFR